MHGASTSRPRSAGRTSSGLATAFLCLTIAFALLPVPTGAARAAAPATAGEAGAAAAENPSVRLVGKATKVILRAPASADADQVVTLKGKLKRRGTSAPVGFPVKLLSDVGSGLKKVATTRTRKRGTFRFTVTVPVTTSYQARTKKSRGYRAGRSPLRRVTVAPVINPTPVRVSGVDLPSGLVGEAYAGSATAADGTPPYTWTRTQGSLPPGLSLTAGGVVRGTPTAAGDYIATLRVTDATGATDTTRGEIRVDPAVVTDPVYVSSTDLPSGVVGQAYSGSVSAADGTPPYTWTRTQGTLPAGLTLSAAGALTGTPTAIGDYSATLRVTDATGGTDSAPVLVTIDPPDFQITTQPLADARQREAYPPVQFTSSGGTAPVTWTLSTGELPTGMTLTRAGVLSGTPPDAGYASFSILATDAAGYTAEGYYSLSVEPVYLAIATTSLPSGTVGAAYQKVLTASGNDGPVTWSLSPPTSLPPGLSLAANGTISGTPQAPGSETLSVVATDTGGGYATADLTLTVNDSAVPVFLDTVLPSAQVGVGYAYRPAVAGGTGTYTWTITAGSLPAGLRLDRVTGLVSGRATTPGSSTVTLAAQDSSGGAQRTLTIQVTGDSRYDHAAGSGRDQRTLGESTLVPATVGHLRLESRLDAADAVDDGVAYGCQPLTGSEATGVVARDVDTGALIWEAPLVVGGYAQQCTELAFTGDLVIGLVAGLLVGLDRSTGEVAWTTEETDPGTTFSTFVTSGTAVVGVQTSGANSSVRSYDPANGTFRWVRTFPGDYVAALAVVDGRAVVLASTGSPAATTIRTFTLDATGTVGWTAPTDAAALTTAPGRVITAESVAEGTRIVLRSSTTGAVVGSHLSEVPFFGNFATDADHVYFSTASFGEFGYAGGGAVTALAVADGAFAWRTPEIGPMYAGISAGGGMVWVHQSYLIRGAETSELYAFAATDGAELQRVTIDGAGGAPPRVAAGRVFVTRIKYFDFLTPRIQAWGVMEPPVRLDVPILPTGRPGTPYAAQLTHRGGTGVVTWTAATALPPGLDLSGSGAITGTPTTAQATDVRVAATDASGRRAELDVTIVVRAGGTQAWRAVRGGITRNGAALLETAVTADATSTYARRWTSALVSADYSQLGQQGEEPLVVGNRVFALGPDGGLRAWDASVDGAARPPLWTAFAPPAAPGGDPVRFSSTPTLVGAAGDGTVYVYTEGDGVAAVAAATGTVAWVLPDARPRYSEGTSPLVVGTTLVTLDLEGTVKAFDVTTRELRWSQPAPNDPLFDMTNLSSDGTHVFVVDAADCTVTARLITSGNAVWSTSVATASGCTLQSDTYALRKAPVVDGAQVLISTSEGVGAIDRATGVLQWWTQIGATNGSPVVTERWVVVANAHFGAISVLDRRTGVRVRVIEAGMVAAAPTVVGDLVVFPSADGRVAAVDLTTGDRSWESAVLPGPGGFPSAVAVARGRLWAYTSSGQVVGIGP